jgi:hypothetical protein
MTSVVKLNSGVNYQWLYEDSPGADRRIVNRQLKNKAGCTYPRKQCIVHKYKEKKNVKTLKKHFFS